MQSTLISRFEMMKRVQLWKLNTFSFSIFPPPRPQVTILINETINMASSILEQTLFISHMVSPLSYVTCFDWIWDRLTGSRLDLFAWIWLKMGSKYFQGLLIHWLLEFHSLLSYWIRNKYRKPIPSLFCLKTKSCKKRENRSHDQSLVAESSMTILQTLASHFHHQQG